MTEEKTTTKLEFSPEIFDPNKEALHGIKAEVAKIEADPEKITKEDLEIVNTAKNKLVKARTAIQKKGKEVRESAIQFQKDVIAYEKELIGIIEPEELRIKEIEKGAKEYAMKQERLKTLPEYKEKLQSINDGVIVTDEELLQLDPNGRDQYYNERLQAKLQKDKEEADARRAEEEAKKEAEAKKLEEEKAAIEREKEKLVLEKKNNRIQKLLSIGFRDEGNMYVYDESLKTEKAVVLDPERFPDADFNKYVDDCVNYISIDNKKKEKEAEERRQAEIKAAEEKARKEAEEKAEQEKAAAEQRRKDEEAEQERLKEEQRQKEEERKKSEAYNNWLKENSYNESTDQIKFDNGVSTLYRKVSEFSHE